MSENQMYNMPNMNFHRKSKRVALRDIEMEVGDEL